MAERTYLVVVGYNATESGDLALLRAIEIARSRNAELHVVHVEDVTPAVLHLPKDVTVSTMDLAALRHQTAWERAAALLDAPDPATRVDLEGSPAKAIVSYCDDVGADLLVIGTRGRGRLASTFLGSTSLRALGKAKCDVMIAKPANR